MVDRGTGCGPSSCCSSANPMQAPLSWPVHGTPSISGMSGLAAFVVKPPSSGELGTSMGTQDVVYTSSSSPLVHAASGVDTPAVGVVTASSGAPTTASASTAAGNSCRAGTE